MERIGNKSVPYFLNILVSVSLPPWRERTEPYKLLNVHQQAGSLTGSDQQGQTEIQNIKPQNTKVITT